MSAILSNAGTIADITERASVDAAVERVTSELGPIDDVPTDASSLAVEWLEQAARQWQRQGAARRGLEVVERAIRLAPRWGSPSRSLSLLQVELLVDLRMHREARAALAELIPQAELAADHVVAAESTRLLGQIEQMEGELPAARRELTKAVEAFRHLGDDQRLADALRARGFAEMFGGSLAEAERFLREAETIFQRVDDPRGRAWVQQNLAWVSFLSGDHEVSERRLRAAIEAFDAIGDSSLDFYPEPQRERIDAINDRVYDTVNNGVYKCGFATRQPAYDEAFGQLFDSLDWLEDLLGRNRYLAGDTLTEADWRLFTTLVRFDAVYHGHFKCNRQRIDDFANLSGYLRELYQMPGVAETVDMRHIQHHYYESHTSINPHRIVPRGPLLDFDRPHGRGRLKAA